ncbi:lipase family alpha/beta hydrolase [Streptomyces sp. NPDC059247]|uniref:lipase family alpha/beta hydrolase n=1 Tax=Streptomyces sp. NPDC059247 TaxID=3346790 RepID=UPI00369BF61B
MRHDLVVFVPGILGSRLTREGRDVWNQSLRALFRLRGRSRVMAEVALPPGIGDGRPEGPYALVADGLLKSPDALPGLLSSLGYPDVRAALGELAEGQYVPFAYDWRLSNRLTARDLKECVERALARWRERVDAFHPDRPDEPRVVLVCHSMGGLVGRYYLECLGGRETARTLVTLGTPHRGAAKAVRFLSGQGVGPVVGDGRLRGAALGGAGGVVNGTLRELALTLPSVAQLLPVYDAVLVPGRTRRRSLMDRRHAVPDLPTALVEDAFAFDREFQDARDANRRGDPGGRLPYRVHCLGGAAHPTVHGVVVAPEGTRFTTDLGGGRAWSGDGTVPRESAFAGWALDYEEDAVWNGYRHADMAGGDSVGHQLSVVREGRAARDLLARDEEFGLDVPECALAGEPFDVLATGEGLARRNLRAVLTRDGVPASPPVPFAGETGRTGKAGGTVGYGEGGASGETRRVSLTAGPGTWVLEVTAEGPRRVCREVVTVLGE